MEHKRWKLLKQERDSLYEQFLDAKQADKPNLLLKIMELDEEMEALEKDQELPAGV